MTKPELLDAIRGRAPKQKDFNAAVDKLAASQALEEFIGNNQVLVSTVRPSAIADQLLLSANAFLDARVGPTIAKNAYDEFSVIFMLCAFGSTNQKSERNGLMKVFRSVIANSSKFDMFVRKGSRNVKVSSDEYTIEFAWLIPLFSNVKVLLAIDVEDFIEENEEINAVDRDYMEGYLSFSLGDIAGLDKDNYKQFMHDGLVALAHSKAIAA
jgi:hypothetical protein